jgi:hypothetical protein
MKSSRSERPGLYLKQPFPGFSSSGQKVAQSFGIAVFRFSTVYYSSKDINFIDLENRNKTLTWKM